MCSVWHENMETDCFVVYCTLKGSSVAVQYFYLQRSIFIATPHLLFTRVAPTYQQLVRYRS